jgi:hypothetical protein
MCLAYDIRHEDLNVLNDTGAWSNFSRDLEASSQTALQLGLCLCYTIELETSSNQPVNLEHKLPFLNNDSDYESCFSR